MHLYWEVFPIPQFDISLKLFLRFHPQFKISVFTTFQKFNNIKKVKTSEVWIYLRCFVLLKKNSVFFLSSGVTKTSLNHKDL